MLSFLKLRLAFVSCKHLATLDCARPALGGSHSLLSKYIFLPLPLNKNKQTKTTSPDTPCRAESLSGGMPC